MQSLMNTTEFAHPILGQEVSAIGGHYVLGKEMRLPYSGREILYFVGYAVLDSTCCGVGGCAYVLVAGYIRRWKYKENQNDRPVSNIEPIIDRVEQKLTKKLIQKKEMVFQVTFS